MSSTLGLTAVMMLIGSAMTSAAKPPADLLNDDIRKQATEWFNIRRCMHQSEPAEYVVYNKCIESAKTQAWADGFDGWGENLAWGSSTLPIDNAMKMWFTDEEPCCDYTTGDKRADAPAGCQIGHFTAMAWKSARAFALGVQKASDGSTYWAMHIGSPSGERAPNTIGGDNYAKNVLKPTRSLEECTKIVQQNTADIKPSDGNEAVGHSVAAVFAAVAAAVAILA